ncbi:hypothetical protein TRVL_04440 [Trypanosoma vivax]|nr:hypothetical protein TRVL_04440 [Trypanosoma vivax]
MTRSNDRRRREEADRKERSSGQWNRLHCLNSVRWRRDWKVVKSLAATHTDQRVTSASVDETGSVRRRLDPPKVPRRGEFGDEQQCADRKGYGGQKRLEADGSTTLSTVQAGRRERLGVRARASAPFCGLRRKDKFCGWWPRHSWTAKGRLQDTSDERRVQRRHIRVFASTPGARTTSSEASLAWLAA